MTANFTAVVPGAFFVKKEADTESYRRDVLRW
jgi:hypothetical protein